MGTLPPEIVHHPAPERSQVSAGTLWFGLVAAPLAWSAQMLSSAALSSHDCYPHEVPLSAPLWPGLWPILMAICVACIAITIAAGVTAWRSWQKTYREHTDSAHGLLTRGEGRTRFMAMSGMLTSSLFLMALLFSVSALVTVPVCGG